MPNVGPRCLLAALPIALAPSDACAQSPPPARGQRLIEVTRATAFENLSTSASGQNGAAPARNGALFVPIVRTRFAGPVDGDRGAVVDSELELWRSDDGGLGWRRANVAPTNGDGNAALIPDGELLACLWSAADGQTFSSVFWQRYDPRTDQWVGSPTSIAAGTSGSDQYHASDLARTDGGALVAVIGNHADPKAPVWNCSWSTGMRWLAADASEWGPLVQVNVNSYGCCATAMARGERVDISYRTCPAEAVHGLRTVDGRTGRFEQDTDENAGNEPAADAYIANVGVLCHDATGGRSLLHLLASRSPGKGRLVVSWSRQGTSGRTTTIADDPVLVAGNENPQHFTLARGPGNQVFAYFSKQSEGFAHLWQCVVEEGVPVGEARRVASGEEGAFVNLAGMRSSGVFSGLHVVALGRGGKSGGGVVSVFGSWPARSFWQPRTG
jgi:hypothetical protein